MSASVGFYRAAWLLVAQGGWWTPQEIIERIPLSVEINEAHSLLWCMARRDGFLSVRGERRKPQYAVTPDCHVPRGMTVREVMEAAAGARGPAHADSEVSA